jgi:Acetyltransferase (GNAT) domain
LYKAAKNSSAAQIHRFDPLRDQRWDTLVDVHTRSSVFHSRAWLTALQRTYGYKFQAYTTSSPAETLQNGAVFCSVDSWLTGRRSVSLPFSDHCDLLVDDLADEAALLSFLQQEYLRDKPRYIEMRPLSPPRIVTDLSCATEEYYHHRIDLRPDLAAIYQSFHKSSIQRKIKRADTEKLNYQEGRSESLLEIFWKLTIPTRRRHGLPPQPRQWFRNLIDCFGESLKIRVAFKNDRPIASILTLRHKDSLVYKYGCSDARFHNMGGMHLLFWRAINDAKEQGLRVFDLGRSSLRDPGLVTFKERWGAERTSIFYVTISDGKSLGNNSAENAASWKARYIKRLVPYTPDSVLSLIGSFLYKHIA